MEIKITKADEGINLTNFLKKKIETNYNTLLKLIRNSEIKLNNKKINGNPNLKNKDIIQIPSNIKLKKDKSVKPLNLYVKKIFENKNLFIFNKPAFLASQGGNQVDNVNMKNHLAFVKKEKNLDYLELAHRIDKETSGILIGCKNKDTITKLQAMFKEHQIKKKYICLVNGVPRNKQGKVELYLKVEDDKKQKVKISNAKEGVYSLSYYRVLRVFNFNNKKFSLIDVEIITGITHQIRVHMKSLGCAIVADRMYGDFKDNLEFYKQGLKRQFLHCYFSEFKLNGEKFIFRAAPIKDLVYIMSKIDKKFDFRDYVSKLAVEKKEETTL